MSLPYPDIPFLEVNESLNESTDPEPLNELFKMSTVGKLFLAGMAAWIMGRSSKLKIRGSRTQIDAVANALRSSRRFQREIAKPGATVQSVMEKLKLKNASASRFKAILGVPWPL